ncbi:hypothetical protein LXL04_010279 [Taraxacum kok-saghyz]
MSNVKNCFTKMLTQIYHVASKSKKLHCYRNRMPEPKRQTIKDEDHNGLRTNIEPPKLSSDNVTIRKHRMISYLNLVDIKFWETIKEGRHTPPLKERNKWSDEDKRKVALDKKAMQILSVSLPNNIYPCVMCCESAKDIWNTLVVLFEGGEDIRESRRSVVIQQYELFTCNPGESLTESCIRFKCLVNEMMRHQCKTFDNEEMVNKFLESLPMEWKSMAIMIRQMGDLKSMSLEGLYVLGLENSSIQHKKRITVGGETLTLDYYKKPTLIH